MTSPGSKPRGLPWLAARCLVIALGLCSVVLMVLPMVLAVGSLLYLAPRAWELYLSSRGWEGWRLFEVQEVVVPVSCTALVYWLMGPEHRHPRAVLLALSFLVLIGARSITFFSIERGVALLTVIAAYAAFKFERRWLARTITLALGAMLAAFELCAVYEEYLEQKLRREHFASCEAQNGVLAVGAMANQLICLMRRAR